MASSTPQLNLDNQLCFALYSASRAAVRAYGPLLAELHLTYPQYLVMLVLWEAEHPVTVGEVGERLHLDSGTLTPVLKRLQDSGLVNRQRDPQDERRVLISLTAHGQALRNKAASIPGKVAECYRIGPDEAKALMASLRAVIDTLGGS